jgi:hypothetical protein
MHRKKFFLVAIVVAASVAIGIITLTSNNTASSADAVISERTRLKPLDETSAEVRVTLPVFRRLNESYMRGSAPLSGSIEVLKKLGVKSLVDLRSAYDHTAEIGKAALSGGLQYFWLPMSVWNAPSDDEANEFISLVTDESKGPFYVFCSDGVNRAGEMSAIYRLARDKWKIERALKEMDDTGFNPYYYTLRNYIWTYARKFYPQAIK